MNLGLRMALGLEGVDDTDAAAIEAALPALERLSAAMAQLDPIIRRTWPDIQAAMPILEKAYPDFIAVLPIVRKLLQLAKGN